MAIAIGSSIVQTTTFYAACCVLRAKVSNYLDTQNASRKNRNFSNFMRNAMRKTIVHLDEKLLPRTERT